MLLDGRFGNGTSGVQSDILVDVLSDFWLVEGLLQHCHCLLHTKVPFHAIAMHLPNQLLTLA